MGDRVIVEGLATLAAIVLYFLPALIADRRHRDDLLTLALFNAVLGWTGFGWLFALYWAYQPNPPARPPGEAGARGRMPVMSGFSRKLAQRAKKRDDRDGRDGGTRIHPLVDDREGAGSPRERRE
ncbi:immunity protein [Burkholderia sp. WAC0059]|nr:immunity protein [Burkholderia sp. WAC0059]